ncbi:MAG: DUF190 domain-containing protein [Anaerolineales bacterium]|nr:DUF190 domain-containing protein [Anaerolineales bacterium]
MRIVGKAKRLRLYIGESDQWRGRPLYLALLEALKAEGLAGATVTRGVAGFGAHARIRTASLEVLSSDLPLVVEIVDEHVRIAQALTRVGPMVREGLVTLDDVEVVKYTHRYLQPLPGDRLVRDVMTRDVVSVPPEAAVADVMDLLIGKQFRAVPVVNPGGQPIGIISDGDLITRGGAPSRVSVTERLDAESVQAQLAALRASGRTAGEVMTPHPITLQDDTTLAHAVHAMVTHGLKRLPVVDAQGRLCGVLSRLDVLRTVAAAGAQVALPTEARYGRTVGDVMDTAVPTVQADADLVDVANQMIGATLKRVAVVDSDQHLLGVITDGDLVARARPDVRGGLLAALLGRGNPPPLADTARDVMTAAALSGPPETPVAEAIQRMLTEQRKRFYVVDRNGRLLGAVDRQALLLAIAGIDSAHGA